jgi:exportin-T
LFYLFYKFIKEGREDIPTDICAGIIASVQDLLQIDVEIPKLDDSEADVLTEVVKSSAFDSQLYLYETAGILCSLLFKIPEQQASLLLSLVKPLMDELSVNLQAATKGSQEVVPIVKVHHIIMALGNISKGFPDYPQPLPPGYILPPLDVFAQVAQAILVCLEQLNVIKIVRDAVSKPDLRFCRARCSLFRTDSLCLC